jgi:F-type H+-transporting ATPase subunit a
MMCGPLEQFEIVSLLKVNNLVLVTNSSRYREIAVGILLAWLLTSFAWGGLVVPSRWQVFFETLYITVLDIVGQNRGTSKSIISGFFIFLITLFTVLLSINRIGIVPYSFTVSSHVIVAGLMGCMIWFGKFIIGCRIHGVKRSALVMPGGAPAAIIAPLIAIETLGFVITAISLPVRLFANMMSGHILLKVLGGFAWTMAISGSVALFGLHRLPMMVLFVLMFRETGVALIQAYVFTLLTCIYFADVISGGH